MNTSKTAIVASAIMGKLRSIVGYGLGTFALVFLLVGLTMPKDSGTIGVIVFMAIIFVGCVFLVISGAKANKRIKRFKRYVSIISKERMNTLDGLASATSQSVDFVTNDLQTMIDKKFFANAHIDLRTREIIIGSEAASAAAAASTAAAEPVKVQTDTKPETEHVKCPGCGAANSKTKGTASTCEYCGTSIK